MARRTWHNRGRPSRPSSRRMKRSDRLQACQAPRNRAGLVWVASILLDGNVASGRCRSLPEDWEYDKNPLGCLAGQSQPAEGRAWQHRGVCRCACEPPIPRVLIKPLAPTSAAIVSAGSCRPLQCKGWLDNGTASCLIGYRSFPMTIRCPSDACFVLPLPCFHPSSNELHGSQDEPIAKDNRPRWRKLEFGQGLEGRLNRKSKKLDAPRFHARADVEPLGFSGQQFFSACLALAGARELRLSSAAVWTVLRGPMADRCRAVFAMLVAWQGRSIRKPGLSTDGQVSCLVDWQLSVLADG